MVEPPAYGGCTDKTVVIHGSKVASGDGVRSVGRLLASEAADAHGGGRSWVSKVFSVDRYGCAASLARKFGRDGRYTGYESLAACTIETELGGGYNKATQDWRRCQPCRQSCSTGSI